VITPFKSYREIDKNSWNVIYSEGAVQIVNGCLMLILLLYLKNKGFSDGDSARFTAARFLGVLLISFPLGIYIKKRKLLPFFRMASIAVPLFTLLSVFAVEQHQNWLIYTSFFFWGIAFSFAEIVKLPFMLRYADKKVLTNAIALSYATWSFGAIIAAVLIYLLSLISTTLFDEKNCIIVISILSLFGAYFSFKIKEPEISLETKETKFNLKEYEWGKIVYSLTPTFLIAVGAGMSIPFVPLFFEHTFNMNYSTFAGYGFLAYILVFVMTMLTPSISKKLGYQIAIPLTQLLSVSCLVMMGVTELFKEVDNILVLAIVMYMLRQPLMNLAQPMTTELIMKYVGKSNHEIVSALMALIWNGSFVVTSLLFAQLRDLNVSFYYIFLITAALYFVAIIWYVVLIKKFEASRVEG
jgi:hypothetical protein